MTRLRLATVAVAIALAACGAPEPRLPPNNLLPAPDVVGQNVRDAAQFLRDQGFEVIIEETPVPDRQPGTVIAQDPAPNEKVLRAYTIHLQVVKAGGGPTPRRR